MNKYIIFSIILLCLIQNNYHKVFAFDLDKTVDDNARKQYNSAFNNEYDDIEDLPDLPDINILENNTYQYQNNVVKPINTNFSNVKHVTSVKAFRTIDVINETKITDYNAKNSTVYFRTINSKNNIKKGISNDITFIGKVAEVHQPQISANGGLVVIKITSAKINNKYYQTEGYISQANGKKIFLNNIKGDRKYLSTLWKNGNWGRNIFNKMMTMTVNLSGEGSTILFSPFPLAYGTLCLGTNAIISPITAFFQKGGHVVVPAGSNFKIKLLNDLNIN